MWVSWVFARSMTSPSSDITSMSETARGSIPITLALGLPREVPFRAEFLVFTAILVFFSLVAVDDDEASSEGFTSKWAARDRVEC